MHALELEEPQIAPKSGLELVWSNPNPVKAVREPEPFLMCRSRRHAQNIVRLMDEGHIREVRRGDRLVFYVYEGPEPSRLRLIPGLGRAA